MAQHDAVMTALHFAPGPRTIRQRRLPPWRAARAGLGRQEHCGGANPISGHVKPDDSVRDQNMLVQIVEYWLEAIVSPGGGDAIVEPAAGANP